MNEITGVGIVSVEEDSETECEASQRPPAVTPRARIVMGLPVGSDRPVNCQPPPTRTGEASMEKFAPPSVLSSNVVCSTSGEEPPRDHVIVVPSASTLIDCVAAVGFVTRAMKAAGVAPAAVNRPPTMILPSFRSDTA